MGLYNYYTTKYREIKEIQYLFTYFSGFTNNNLKI